MCFIRVLCCFMLFCVGHHCGGQELDDGEQTDLKAWFNGRPNSVVDITILIELLPQ